MILKSGEGAIVGHCLELARWGGLHVHLRQLGQEQKYSRKSPQVKLKRLIQVRKIIVKIVVLVSTLDGC